MLSDAHQCALGRPCRAAAEFTDGLVAARDKVALMLWRSEQIKDSGMYGIGLGSEDASERSYHRGLQDAINTIETILND